MLAASFIFLIARDIFYARLDGFCRPCEHWSGACLKGHDLRSPTGCPIQKFPPVQGAIYDEDRPAVQALSTGVGCCGEAESIPDMTWPQVLAHFGEALLGWIKAGTPLATREQHAARFGICKQNKCERYTKFHCSVCKCLAYVKAKVATEDCPLGLWPKL